MLGFSQDFTVEQVLTPAVRASTVNGAGLDIEAYTGTLGFILYAEAMGSGKTADFKIEHSDDNITFGGLYFPYPGYGQSPTFNTVFGFTLTLLGPTYNVVFDTETAGKVIEMDNNTYAATATKTNASSEVGPDGVITNKATTGFDVDGEADFYDVIVVGLTKLHFARVGNALSKQTLYLPKYILKRYVRVALTVAGGLATGLSSVIMVGIKE